MSHNSKTSILWQFNRPDSNVKNYLLASIHLMDADIELLFDKLKVYVDSCNSFATEIDFSYEMHYDAHQFIICSDPAYLESESHRISLMQLQQNLLRYHSIDISQLLMMKPIILMSMISLLILKLDPSLSLDRKLFDHASEHNKFIFGLEDFQQHFNLLNKISECDQFSLIKKSLTNLNKFKKDTKSALQKYKAQHLSALYQLSKKSLGSYKRVMLYDRNKIMMDSIIKNETHGSMMIACGAAHLMGKSGILALLKQNKYRLQAINL